MDAAVAAARMTDRVDDIELRLLLEALYQRYHYDFRGYARSSLRRRLRVAMDKFGCKSLSQLQHRLLHESALLPELMDILTVQVSEMFRDPLYFLALRQQVMPLLRTYPSLKIWVAGCSTGEEVYSLAILLKEEGLLERSLIYATDINAAALEKAQAGVYEIDRISGFTENHRKSGGHGSLSAYYTAAYGKAAFDRSLKKHVTFADHSLSTDSAFSEVQLISCRNVLIYFDRALQDRAVGLFRDSLCYKGFLGIGASESLRFSLHADSFAELDHEDRIYQKVAA
jgi:chemotaxis protein methyltransferase CheR